MAHQVQVRAWLLGQRLGLPREWLRWRQVGSWMVALLAVCMAAQAWMMVQAVTGAQPQGGSAVRAIHLVAALMSLLGLHTAMLLLWLAGWAWSLRAGQPAAGNAWSLGAWALQWSARLPLHRGPHAAALLQGTLAVLQQQRLSAWLLGSISHTVWALACALMWVGLWLAFSFHAYQLTWESTIWSDAVFQRVVHGVGWLPAQLGFATPDAPLPSTASLPHSAGDTHQQAAWAWWLMACVLCYGLLPRLVLALLSLAVLRYKLVRARPPASAYWHKQANRIAAWHRPVVTDPEQRPASTAPTPTVAHAAPALLAFEWAPDMPWPPTQWTPAWHAPVGWMHRMAGSSAERADTIAQLERIQPRKLVVLVRAHSSPDRGTARFIRQLQHVAAAVAVLPVLPLQDGASAPPPESAHGAQRWQHWLAEQDLPVPLLADVAAAQHWLTAAA